MACSSRARRWSPKPPTSRRARADPRPRLRLPVRNPTRSRSPPYRARRRRARPHRRAARADAGQPSTIWCGCRAPRRRSCARCCWNSKSPAGWSGTAARWCPWCRLRGYDSNPPDTLMIFTACRRMSDLFRAVRLASIGAARRDPSTTFVSELWPDAQAKGITRATFDLAMRASRPIPRVIAATKKQPEYSKPAGAYVNGIVIAGRIKRGGERSAEWAQDVRRRRKEIFGRALGAAVALGHGDRSSARPRTNGTCSARSRRSAYVKYRHPYFRNELHRRDGHHAGRPHRARQDRQLMGRRHGPDPVHADELCRLCRRFFRRRARPISGPTCRTCSARPPTICRNSNGSTACPGASRSWCRTASTR